VLLLDVVVFRWANRVSEHLDENRMLIMEKVFGFLLAARAVQLTLNGLADLGVDPAGNPLGTGTHLFRVMPNQSELANLRAAIAIRAPGAAAEERG
jgi:hypothetical protein